MKKSLFAILLLLGSSATFAQLKQFTLQPGAAGIDANIFSRSDAVNSNKGNDVNMFATNWTWDGNPGTNRSLIKFDLTTVPKNIVIDSVKLFLYADDYTFTQGIATGHSSHTVSNASTLKRVTSAWDENTVTWNNQPKTGKDSVLLAESTSGLQTYKIKVTSMVLDMLNNPSTNHGFLLKTLSEKHYNGLVFGSSDNTDAAIRPALVFYYNQVTTGIEEAAAAKTAVKAYPNPSNGSFKIEADNLVSVVVSDVNGNTESFDSANITTSLTGILFAKVITADTIEVVKLFVK